MSGAEIQDNKSGKGQSATYPTSSQKHRDIDLRLLQNFSFELITDSVKLWRTYASDKRGKGEKIAKAVLIHKMLMDAIKIHPDIVEIELIREAYEELKAVANARGFQNGARASQ